MHQYSHSPAKCINSISRAINTKIVNNLIFALDQQNWDTSMRREADLLCSVNNFARTYYKIDTSTLGEETYEGGHQIKPH